MFSVVGFWGGKVQFAHTGVRALLTDIKWCLFLARSKPQIQTIPSKTHFFTPCLHTYTVQWAPSVISPICSRPFQVFPPQTRRTFKVFSDNVTVVVHLFPIRCNLPSHLGKFSFIFILYFSPFVPFVFSVCLISSWHMLYSPSCIFYILNSVTCHHTLLAALGGW